MQRDTLTCWSVLGLILPLLGSACAGAEGGDDPAEANEIAADTYAVTSEQRLLHFQRSTGAIRSAIELTGMGADDGIVGMDFRPLNGTLFVVSRTGTLYSLNPERGALVVMTSLMPDPADTTSPFSGLEGEVFGINFNPVADRLRIVSDSGQNLRVNVETGATVTDAALNPGSPSVAAASYSNSFANACRTQLFVIDDQTGTLLLQDPPNDGSLTAIGRLPGAVGALLGFEIVSGAGALAAFADRNGAAIYDLDIRSGAVSDGRVLRLEAGERLVGVSAPPPPTPRQARGEFLGVNILGELISFNRGAPGNLCTRDPITGIDPNEEVLGIDVRPADGELYALGSSGTIYTLDESGEATLHAALAADPMDASNPYTGLEDSDYGIGFNPVPDRLRVVSRSGTNLRINVDTGATTTDVALSPSSMAVPAIAYTNAYAGATSTALYAVDAASSALMLIGGNPATAGACPGDTANPNCGSVSLVGPLGLEMRDVGGFDIDGAQAATGWLALSAGSAARSSLVMVDLATGAVTTPPGVANPTIGGDTLRALTFASNPAAR
jgi:outer membrane protein assembly factor BamB